MCAFSLWSHCSGKVYSSDDIRPAGMTASTTTTTTTTTYLSRAGTECVYLHHGIFRGVRPAADIVVANCRTYIIRFFSDVVRGP